MTSKRPGIFMSHCRVDKEFVRRLTADLERSGARVWLDEAEMLIGDSLLEKIQAGIERTDYLAVVLSPASVKSEWVKREVEAAMTHEIRGKRVKVLPLLLKECVVPAFLAGRLYADFTHPHGYARALSQVLQRLGLTPENSSGLPIGGRRDFFSRVQRTERIAVYRVRQLHKWPYETLWSVGIDDLHAPMRLPTQDDLSAKFRCFGTPEQYLEWGMVERTPHATKPRRRSRSAGAVNDTWIQVEYVLFRSTERADDRRVATFRQRLMADGIDDTSGLCVAPTTLEVGSYNDPHFDHHELGGDPSGPTTCAFVSTFSDIPYINAQTIPEGQDYHVVVAEVVDFRRYERPPSYYELIENHEELFAWYLRMGGTA